MSGSVSAVSCGETITANTVLNKDLMCPMGHGIVIGEDGIKIDGAGHTIISGSGAGVQLVGRRGVTIQNLNVENSVYGIFLRLSDANIIKDNTFSNNQIGVMFELSSNNNIHNNRFNNDQNVIFTSSSNDWSSTKEEITNIVDGPWKSGNFWAKPDGTGFSETCADSDNDGICDQSFVLDIVNKDDYPLTYPPKKSQKNTLKLGVIIIPLLLVAIVYILTHRGKEETPF